MRDVSAARLLLSGALAVASVSIAAFAATSESFVYDELMSGESVVIYPRMESLGVGESTFDARYCSSDSEFACFASHSYAFAIRKNGSCNSGSWTVDGRKYSVAVPLHQRYLLGKMQEICMIESSITRGGESISSRYLYSPVDGLLVMEVRVRRGAELRLQTYVARARGFGAVVP